MNHDRPALRAISIHIFKLEPLRKVVIHLNRTKLPLTANGILDHKVKFRTIESSLAQFHNSLEPLVLCGQHNSFLRLLPILVRADIFCLVGRITK